MGILQSYIPTFLLLLTTSMPRGTAHHICPLLGPVFPAPTNLGASPVIQAASEKLRLDLDGVVNSGKTPYGEIPTNSTSFSVGIFDKSSAHPLLTYQHSSLALENGEQGTQMFDEDSIYRLASVSKLITSYLLLLEAGSTIWERAITDFVPELAQAVQQCSPEKQAVGCVDGRDVTLGAQASHQSGILRDWSRECELLNAQMPFTELGLPPLPDGSAPSCNALGSAEDALCDKATFLGGGVSEHPVYQPFATPIYSNAAYALLGLALENIARRSFDEVLQTHLLHPLNMTRSSYNPPTQVENAVMPGGMEASGFNISTDLEAPDGGFFTSQADMMRLGQSILASTLLPAAETRRWMRPETHTSYGSASVGKPWEIWTVKNLSSHLFDLYTKSGDIFSYGTLFAQSPDDEVGFVVLAAGEDTHSVARDVSNPVAEHLFPALEEEARQQADANLAGNYSSTVDGLNSSLSLTTRAEEPGLIVTRWVSNSTDFLSMIASKAGSPLDVRLYPTNLMQDCDGLRCISFRAVFQGPTTGQTGGVFSQGCITWNAVDLFQYGGVGLDELLFTVDERGQAVLIAPRALRTELMRT